MKKIRGLLIDPFNKKSEVVEIEDKLEVFYKMIDCSTINIANRMINGKEYAIVVDDEGLFKEENKVSAKSPINQNLVGKLLIFNDGMEDLESLTNEDIKLLRECIIRFPFAIITDVIVSDWWLNR